MTHLDPTAVLQAAEGIPSAETRRHLARCRECRRRVEEVRRLLRELEAAPAALEGPPPGLDRWARAVARNARSTPSRRRRLTLLDAGPTAAIRGGGTRAWLVGGGGVQVDLRAVPTASGRFTIHGHVLRPEGSAAGWRVRVVVRDQADAGTFTDPWGEFTLEERPPGRFGLVLEGDGERLETPLLELE